jgi:uncharacterized membrane protein YphA (DoxX/SURF4 family)
MRTRKLTVVPRIVLALMFIAGPLASALHLAPEPSLPPAAAAFMSALAASGYMLPLLWSTEIAAGLLLLSGLTAPLGLILLAPVIVNIAAFHVFLAPTALPPAIVACALEAFLAWQYRDAFAPLFQGLRTHRASRASEFEARPA